MSNSAGGADRMERRTEFCERSEDDSVVIDAAVYGLSPVEVADLQADVKEVLDRYQEADRHE